MSVQKWVGWGGEAGVGGWGGCGVGVGGRGRGRGGGGGLWGGGGGLDLLPPGLSALYLTLAPNPPPPIFSPTPPPPPPPPPPFNHIFRLHPLKIFIFYPRPQRTLVDTSDTVRALIVVQWYGFGIVHFFSYLSGLLHMHCVKIVLKRKCNFDEMFVIG